MTGPLQFSKAAIMSWNGNPITDHNRGALSITPDPIETTRRMANGTMRKYFVADKMKFSVSWSDVPHSKDFTVDGFWGGGEMEEFYRTVRGPFTLRVVSGNGTSKDYSVMISRFSWEVSKRGLYDFWDVQVEMEEV
jgi:hypothetical protein